MVYDKSLKTVLTIFSMMISALDLLLFVLCDIWTLQKDTFP